MKVFLVCPVRALTNEEKAALEQYVRDLEMSGHKVHWPPRDTDQDDPLGLRICLDNRQAIEGADEVHIWWNDTSQGSLFDFGMAFALQKKIVLANANAVPATSQKSFSNVLLAIDGFSF